MTGDDSGRLRHDALSPCDRAVPRSLYRTRRTTRLLLILLVVWTWALPAQAQYGGGNGTAEAPYLIFTPEQLNAVGANRSDWHKHFKLMADIDLAQLAGPFSTIGYYVDSDNNRAFTGVFDGNGKTILSFSYQAEGTGCRGMFGCVSGGTIRDLELVDPDVEITGGPTSCAGILVGWLTGGTVVRCRLTGGSVSCSAGQDWVSIGGVGVLVGETRGNVIDCHTRGTKINADIKVGGLAGSNTGTITRCTADCTVQGTEAVGGLLGHNSYYSEMADCYGSGHVSGAENVGGLVGLQIPSTIARCWSDATVSGQNHVGGLIGRNLGGITDACYAVGDVSGGFAVGGFIGTNSPSCPCTKGTPGVLTDCYSLGTVAGEGTVGGFAGRNEHLADFITCYTACAVTGDTEVGGLVGFNGGDANDSFWDVEATGIGTMCGREDWSGRGCDDAYGMTTTQMETAETYLAAGWDFTGESTNGHNDIWRLCGPGSYPELAWQSAAGDLLCPEGVAFEDFCYLASRWLEVGCGPDNADCGRADLDGSGDIGIPDVAIFSAGWLEGIR